MCHRRERGKGDHRSIRIVSDAIPLSRRKDIIVNQSIVNYRNRCRGADDAQRFGDGDAEIKIRGELRREVVRPAKDQRGEKGKSNTSRLMQVRLQ